MHPGGVRTAMALFFFYKVSFEKHPTVHVLQQGTFKHILIKYFRQDSEIDSIDLHNNGIFPVIEFQVEVSHNMYFSDSQT